MTALQSTVVGGREGRVVSSPTWPSKTEGARSLHTGRVLITWKNDFESVWKYNWTHLALWFLKDPGWKKGTVLPSANSDNKSGLWNQNKLMNAFPSRKKNCCSTVLNRVMNKKEEHKTKRPLRIKRNTVLSEWTRTFCFVFFLLLSERTELFEW